MIIADRRQLLNGNSFILGVSGSGKTFTAKNEIVSVILKSEFILSLCEHHQHYKILEKNF